jgi:hypothetical protein
MTMNKIANLAVYRVSYALFLATGHAAARLAKAFRTLAAAHGTFGPLVVALQLPLLLCWLVVRPLSLATFSVCESLAPRL